MSNPGFMSTQGTPQPAPNWQQQMQQQMQQQQNMQRQQAMAQALMGNQAQGQNSGLANAGNDFLGALTMRHLQQQQNDPQNQVMQQRYGMSAGDAQGILHPSLLSRAKGLFSMGGGS